jgi:hypothetical protein
MPFIRGRYHINPIAGAALEAAREAEEALAALESDGDRTDADSYEWEPAEDQGDKGPIHRVEVESASLVPAHSGEVTHGYVARVHRATYGPSQDGGAGGLRATRPLPSKPETHVFADHNDLVEFLRRELAKDASKQACTRGD